MMILLAGIYALSSNDIKVGTSIEVDGAPWRVLEFLHVKPGKGAAFVRTKIRNYVNGSTVERTFRAGITVSEENLLLLLSSSLPLSSFLILFTFQMEEANVFKETKQFTYKDGSQFVFMDLSSYEETRLNEADMGDKTKWLKEGMDCNLLYWKDKVLIISLLLLKLFSPLEEEEERTFCFTSSSLSLPSRSSILNFPLQFSLK